jgi:sugar lactone lactonase YvrE
MRICDFSGARRVQRERGSILAGAIFGLLAMVAAGAAPVAAAQSLWVANTNSSNIEQFNQAQLKESNIAHPSLIGTAAQPFGIAFDRKGNLWSTVGGTQVQEFLARQLRKAGKNSSPTPAVVITSSAFHKLVGCNFDRAGNLWIADASGAIYQLSAAELLAGAGALTPAITITAPAYFASPQFVAFDKLGNLWVSDENANSIFEFTPGQLGAGGNQVPRVIGTGLAAPGELAFDHKQNLWAANFDNATVVEFAKADLQGTGSPAPAITVTSPNSILNGAWGVAFDQRNYLWVANFRTGAIVRFGPVQLTAKHPLRPKTFLLGAQDFSYQITFGPTN